MAQLVLGVAGAVIGSYFGPVGTQVGFAIGSYIGGAIGPAQKQQGPKLADLKAASVAYGSVLPYIEAHPRLGGALVWQSDKREIATTESSGKGGPSVETETYTYECDCLYLVENQIAGVRRIWSNGELVWTAADDADAESLLASSAVINWRRVTVYTGAATQLPDPTYEAALGAGNAPAYRGRGGIFFEGLNLGNSGQFPNLTFEFVQASNEGLYTSAILFAPLALDKEDDVTPTATATVIGSSGLSFDGLRATMNNVAAVHSVQIRYSHSGGKLNSANYIGQQLTIAAYIAPLTWGGNDPTWGLLFSYDGLSQDATFHYKKDGGTVQYRTNVYHSGAAHLVEHGLMPLTEVEYKIVLDQDNDTVHFYVDGILIRTASGLTRPNGDIYLHSEYRSGYNVTSLSYRDLRVYVGSDPFTATTYTAEDAPLDEVVERQCERAGLPLAYVDASALAVKSVRAMAVTQITSPRQVIDMLAAAYQFEAVESDILKFVLRGGAPAVTIPYEEMGAAAGADTPEPLPLVRGNDIETPVQVTVKFSNVDDDYQDGSEQSDRLITGGSIVQAIELPLGLTPTEARRIADIAVMDVAASVIRVGPVALTRLYAAYEPTDVVLLTGHDGSTFRARLTKRSDAAGILTFDGVLDDASAITSVAETSGGYTSSSIVRSISATTMELLDIPLLRDADDGPGFYVAVKPSGTKWGGCVIYASADGVTYAQAATLGSETEIGTCTTTLGNWTGGAIFDETNSVTVNIGDQTLANWSRDDILAGAATGYLIGSELVYARTAAYVSPGVYTLTGLLRGRRGTEWAIPGHTSSERFVALPVSGAGMARVTLSTTDIGVLRHYKAVTNGLTLDATTGQTFTCTGVSQIPFAPVDLRAAVTDSAVEVTWKRRTRYATRFTGAGGISVPLGETSEAYTAELRDGSSALVSTETVTEAAWSNGSAALVLTLAAPTRSIASIGGEIVGIFDDEQFNSANPPAFERLHATTGAQIARSPTIGSQVYQWCADGDNLYAAAADISYASTPAYYTAGRVVRYDRSSLSAPAATYTAATAGDPAGVAHDGTDVWMTERYGDNLRKLNASTLASSATYAMGDEVGALVHDAGTLWICSPNTDEVIEWDIGTLAELSRISVAYRPMDVLVVGSYLWVLSATELAVYNKGTGALIATAAVSPLVTFAGKTLCEFDGDVACIDVSDTPHVVTLLDAATGATVRTVVTADPYIDAVSAVGTTLYITSESATHVVRSAAYELSAPGLSGYSLTVAQQGALGDGYTATIDL